MHFQSYSCDDETGKESMGQKSTDLCTKLKVLNLVSLVICFTFVKPGHVPGKKPLPTMYP